jgi:flavin-dependent dehydrogenase
MYNFFGEEVKNFEVSNGNVDIFTNKNKYSARILVGADGVRGFVHRAVVGNNKIKKILGYEMEIPLNSKKDENHKFSFTDNKGNKFALKDNIRLDFKGVKKGYCWVFPKNNYLSCGMGALEANIKNMKKYFNLFASNFYRSSEEMKLQKSFAQGIPVRNKNTPLCDYRVLNIGDAACLGDGFTGEGLYNSFKSSIFASESIIHALKNSIFNFEDYQSKIVEDIYRDIKISLFITKIFSGSFAFFYALLKKNDNLFNSCCKILRGEKTYSYIAKKLKLLKIL